jgi:hypothetical protein
MTSRLFFATPAYNGYVHSALTQSLLELSAAGFSVQYVTVSGCGVGLMRDRLVNQFLKTKAEILFMVDADQSFTVQDIYMMLAAIERGAHIVGASGALKRLDLEALSKAFNPAEPLQVGELLRAGITQHNVWFLPEGPTKGFKIGDKIFCEVDYVGTGLIAITRKAIEGISLQAKKYHYEGESEIHAQLFRDGSLGENGTPEGEDAAFCRLARKSGFPVYCFVNCDVLHHEGMFAFPSNLEACMRAAGHKLEF